MVSAALVLFMTVGLANMSGRWPGTHIPKLDFMAFQMMFAIITPAPITGALAGRLKFKAWIAICLGWASAVPLPQPVRIGDPRGGGDRRHHSRPVRRPA
jgi:ammonia channel protein AmtB